MPYYKLKETSIDKAKKAYKNKKKSIYSYNQETLAEIADVNRTTVSRFLRGFSTGEDKSKIICEELGLNWETDCEISFSKVKKQTIISPKTEIYNSFLQDNKDTLNPDESSLENFEMLKLNQKAYLRIQLAYSQIKITEGKNYETIANELNINLVVVAFFVKGENVEKKEFITLCKYFRIEYSISFDAVEAKSSDYIGLLSLLKRDVYFHSLEKDLEETILRLELDNQKIIKKRGVFLEQNYVRCLSNILEENLYPVKKIIEDAGIRHPNTISRILNNEKITPESKNKIEKFFFKDAKLFLKLLITQNKINEKISSKIGYFSILGMETPIHIDDIYVEVKILKKISKNQLLNLNELTEQEYSSLNEIYDKGFTSSKESIDATEIIKKHKRITFFGKPGAGKTTLLKKVTLEYLENKISPFKIPIFLEIKSFVAQENYPKINEYLLSYFDELEVEITDNEIKQLLDKGVFVFLFDGLDEVEEEHQAKIVNYIDRYFVGRNKQCQVVLSSRILSRKYTSRHFREFEISDFSDEQIKNFLQSWFTKDSSIAYELKRAIDKNKRLFELATSPLLLTLICIVYENRDKKLPETRAELYKEGIDVLVEKWDEDKHVKRYSKANRVPEIHQKAALQKLAFYFFSKDKIFFYRDEYQKQLLTISKNVTDNISSFEDIDFQNGIIVERANNIFSFSHLTFQEYLTAKELLEQSAIEKDRVYGIVASHIFNSRWREVIILFSELIGDSDGLLDCIFVQINKQLREKYQIFHPIVNWVKNQVEFYKENDEKFYLYDEQVRDKIIFSNKMYYYAIFIYYYKAYAFVNELQLFKQLGECTYNRYCSMAYRLIGEYIKIHNFTRYGYIQYKYRKYYNDSLLEQLHFSFNVKHIYFLIHFLDKLILLGKVEKFFRKNSYSYILKSINPLLNELEDHINSNTIYNDNFLKVYQEVDLDCFFEHDNFSGKYQNLLLNLRNMLPDKEMKVNMKDLWWKQNGTKVESIFYEILSAINLDFVINLDENSSKEFSDIFYPVINILFYIKYKKFIF